MKKLDIEGISNEASDEVDMNEQEESVLFSSKLVDFLHGKAKVFSNKNNYSLTLGQLKKVYCHSARLGEIQKSDDINLYSLARVNMFLRLKSGERMIKSTEASEVDSMTELQLETLTCKTPSKFIDISEGWIPNAGDFTKAREEIKENNLEYSYKSINNLYLEYEPLEPNWED